MALFLAWAKGGGWDECGDDLWAWYHDTPGGYICLTFKVDPTLEELTMTEEEYMERKRH